MIYDEYIEYTAKYKALYGEHTLVLMEIGGFFELYGVDNSQEKEGADMSVICDLLNIQMSRKNKSVPENSRANPLMAGFPNHVLKKFVDILVAHQFTVVLVEQVTPPPNPKRKVTQVLSPSTYLDMAMTYENRYLMCIVFDTCESMGSGIRRPYLTAACAFVDMTTGSTMVYEVPGCWRDDSLTFEELQRLCVSFRPQEVVVIGDGVSNTHVPKVLQWMERTQSNSCCKNYLGKGLDTYRGLAYQNQLLKKVFPSTGLLSVVEYIGLETRPMALLAFCYLLQFAYEHNETIIQKIRPPTILDQNTYMVLANQCLEHLNIIPRSSCGHHKKYSSILTMLNTCATNMGKRCFKDRLVHPLVDAHQIRKRLDAVAWMCQQDRYVVVSSYLGKMHDVERLFRRMSLGLLQPSEFAMLDTSLRAVVDVSVYLHKQVLPPNVADELGWLDTHLQSTMLWMDTYTSLFDMSLMHKQNLPTLDHNLFRQGVLPTADEYTKTMAACQTWFAETVSRLNTIAQDGEPVFKLESNDRDEHFITITKKRYETFEQLLTKSRANREQYAVWGLSPQHLDPKQVSSSNKSILRVFHDKCVEKNHEWAQTRRELKDVVSTMYLATLQEFIDTYQNLFPAIVAFVSTLDVLHANARNAVAFHYTQPIVHERGGAGSIKAVGIRHPLIERIQDDVEYVTNDITLGEGFDQGMLLYGINAVGKSSLMKSVGINLIMAQAGMYVAAESFELSPYTCLCTRLPGGDNLFKGQSTFVAEMAELRTILQRASPTTLVIGDELCSGTESISAVSIVAAGILHLIEKQSSFIFATHLHELAQLEDIQSLPRLGIFHLSVVYDGVSNQLIYERKLRKGCGDSLYGLEVCKSLDLDPSFLHAANRIRQKTLGMLPNLLGQAKSRYNAMVFKDVCALCGQIAEEVHHIQQQKDADSTGFVGHTHKNSASNLIGVCERCHHRIHNNETTVHGYRMTSDGPMLHVQSTPTTSSKSIVVPDADIIELKRKGATVAAIIKTFSDKGVVLSRYAVTKVVKSHNL
jgi:DNA mismatch repair protein MutS